MPIEPIAILPTAGILIGGAMTATSIAGPPGHRGAHRAARLLRGCAVHRAVPPRRRRSWSPARPPALALIPGLDQTRTVGLVTLPGAFVGVLLAGASPLQAGAVQLLVLLALLLVQVLAVASPSN